MSSVVGAKKDNTLEPIRVNILLEAADLTGSVREQDYGDPSQNLRCAAELKLVFRKHCGKRPISSGEQEAIDRCFEKLARVATGPIVKRDNYIDLAGYAAIAGEIAENIILNSK